MAQPEPNPDRLAEIVEEWQKRLRRGERPNLAEYVAKYPDLADELRELLPGLAAMEDLKGDVLDYTVAPQSGGTEVVEGTTRLEQLGDFRILREVGRGGMGVVYEAEQVSLGRRVALKVLPRKVLIDPKQKRRFEREAKSAAKLHHTNIVPVFGVGEHDGIPYYVMQFIEGLPLDSVLNEVRRMNAGPDEKPVGDAFAPTQTRHDVSAVNVARSLVTGNFGGIIDNDATSSPETPARQSKPASGSAVNAESRIGSTPSIALPGDGSTDTRSKSRPRTYWQSIAALGAQVADALEHAHKQGILHRDIKPSNLLLDTHGTVWVTDFGLAKGDDQENLTHTGDILGTLRYMPPEAFEGKSDARGDIYSLGLTLYELLALRPAFDEKDRHLLIKNVTSAEPARLEKLNSAIPRDLVTIIHKSIDRDPAHRYRTARELTEDLQHFIADEPIQARRSTPWEKTLRWMRRKPAAAALVGMSAVAAVALAASVIVVLYNSKLHDAWADADHARNVAESSRDAEAIQRQIAEAALLEAKTQKDLADVARTEAERQQKLADTARKEAENQREQAILQRGLLAVHTKQWAEAAADLVAYCKSHPDDIKAWLSLGQAQAGLGERVNSVSSFTKVIDLSADNVAARLGRAEQRFALGQYNDAIADYEHAFRINPDLPEHAAAYARALYEGATNWRVLLPTQATSTGRLTLKIHPDGSMAPTSYASDSERYTIVAPLGASEIRTVRLEILTDPGHQSSPYPSGYFVLGDFIAQAQFGKEPPRRMEFDRAWANYATTYTYYPSGDAPRQGRSSWDVSAAIDRDPQTGWGVYGQYNRGITAVFVAKEPIRVANDSSLTVELRFPMNNKTRQNSLGRFRLSVNSSVPNPAWECLINSTATNVSGWIKLAAARFMRGDRDGANDALTRADRISRDQLVVNLLRSIILDQPDRRADAQAAYDRAFEQAKSNTYAHQQAYGYGDLSMRWLAVEAAARWIERDPNNIVYRRHRAEALSALDSCADAIADYDQLIKAEPSEFRHVLERGDCYLRLGNSEKAKDDFSAAGHANADDSLAWYRQKLLTFESTSATPPVEYLDACLELEKDKPGAFEYLVKRGRVHAQAGRMNAAGEDFAKAVELNPKAPDAILERGGWLLQKGEREKAIADFTTARKLNSSVAFTWHSNQLYRVEYGPNRNVDQLLVHLNELIEMEGQAVSNRINFLQRRIWTFRQANRLTEAIADYGRLIQLTPRDVASYIERAGCYAQTGQIDKAKEDLAAAVKIDRSTAQTQVRLKLQTSEMQRDWAMVAAYIDAAMTGKLSAKDEADLLRRRARARRELGQLTIAFVDCERSLKLDAENVEAIRLQAGIQIELADELQLRGEMAKAQEQRKAARAALEKQYAAQPNNVNVAAELANVILAEVAAWHILDVVEVKSQGGATLTRLEDGSVLAKGTNPPNDVYTVTVKTNESVLRAIRLEAMPDPSLPLFGPGRAPNGNFVMGEFRARASSADGKDVAIEFDQAWASFETRGAAAAYPVRDAIDGKRWSPWGILPQAKQGRSIGMAQVAVFTTKNQVVPAKDGRLVMTMEFGYPKSTDRNLGRFRLFASSSDKAFIAEQLRLTALNGQIKLAAARSLSGDINGAKDIALRHASTKTASLYFSLAWAWIYERIGETEKAKTTREQFVAELQKHTDNAPLPLPSIALEVLSKADEKNEIPSVHLWRGRVLDHLGNTKEAAAAYGKAIELKPDDPDIAFARSQLYLRTQQWKLAAADLRAACDLKTDDHFLWFTSAPVFMLAGDEGGYRKHRALLLERFGNNADAQLGERTAKACSLLPPTESEAKVLIELGKRATSAGTDAGIAHWAHMARALVCRCVDDWKSAVEHAQTAREKDGLNAAPTSYIQVGTRLIEAIASHKLGKTDDAKRLLAEAEELFLNELPDIEQSNPDGQFHDLVICKLLEREAIQLIKRDDGPRERGPMPRELGK